MNPIVITTLSILCILIGFILGHLIQSKHTRDIKNVLSNTQSGIEKTVTQISDNIRFLQKDVASSRESAQRATSDLEQHVMNQLMQSQNESMRTQNELFGSFRGDVGAKVDKLSETNAKQLAEMRDTVEAKLQRTLNDNTRTQNELFVSFRDDINTRLDKLSETNASQLAEMRETVDSKLQKTLDEKLQNSFNAVVEQLSKVQEGLGTMQALATDVGGLKKVLSNVKTRGMLGEIQLGAILAEVLTKEQYDENVVTIKGTKNPVEYAVKLPGQNKDEHIYLPIDSKFPMDTYQNLLDAYDSAEGGDKNNITAAWKQLEIRLKQEAKDIHEKYVHVPETTEFAIMFLPTEGLYAEAVRRGMIEVLQREYRVMIAGPTTMAALLNSLQMGFKTLEVQKSSADVWKVLNNVKSEFGKFEEALIATQRRLRQTDEELDKLVGTRTRMMNRQLNKVISPGSIDSAELLPELPE